MNIIPECKSIQLANAALLVIDVQNYFFSSSSPAYIKDSEKILPVIERIVKSFKEHSSLILGTIHTGYNANMEKWWGHTVDDKWALPLIHGIPLIRKSTYDAFVDTDLDFILQQNAIKKLIITGAMTHLCCETTARSGFVKGYDIMMIKDACIAKTKQYHENSLYNLAHGVATIIESHELVW